MNQNVRPGNLDLGVAPEAAPLADSAAYRDTIGAYTYYEGLRSMRVAGYGLVAGLGGEGASDCPRNIYNRLVQRLYKRHNFAGSRVGEITRTPEELIKSRDTAVVIVQANIPAGAVRGSRFDVSVSALPGTQTKSLIGGRLYATDLEILRPVSSSKAISGQVLAQAAGPLFINPFSGGDSATSVSPRHAVIVNGGLCLQDRRLRLVLMRPSYQLARRIQDRVNAFFPGPRLTADAVSPSFVRLRVPEEYSDDTAHFLGLVRALYLSRRSAWLWRGSGGSRCPRWTICTPIRETTPPFTPPRPVCAWGTTSPATP
ncbi:MAG: flagellar basal body P-ring protein FlgI [Phycisphaerae bacterium]